MRWSTGCPEYHTYSSHRRYGPASKNSESAINILLDIVQDKSGKQYNMDHYATRYPTNVVDIANFLARLCKQFRPFYSRFAEALFYFRFVHPPDLVSITDLAATAENLSVSILVGHPTPTPMKTLSTFQRPHKFSNDRANLDSSHPSLFCPRTVYEVRNLPRLLQVARHPYQTHHPRRQRAYRCGGSFASQELSTLHS